MILAYQVLLPRKRKLSPQLRALAPPPAKPLPLIRRIRMHCNTLLTRPKRRAPSAENGGRHRTLRSLHLNTPERKGRRQEMRSRFAGPLRLDLNFPSFPKSRPVPFYASDPFRSASPHDYKHFYSRMHDAEEYDRLVRPDSAVISPWSPFEDILSPEDVPQSHSSIPCGTAPGTPSSLSPLPSAYLHGTPIRYGFPRVASTDCSSPTRGSLTSHASPMMVAEDVDTVDTNMLIEEIERVLEYTRDWAQEDEQIGSFVIGEDEDMDYETVSIGSANGM